MTQDDERKIANVIISYTIKKHNTILYYPIQCSAIYKMGNYRIV